jgi:hypothetical protein
MVDGDMVVTMDIPTMDMADIMADTGDARRGTLKKPSEMTSAKRNPWVVQMPIMDTTMEATVPMDMDMGMAVDTDGEDGEDTMVDIEDTGDNHLPIFQA